MFALLMLSAALFPALAQAEAPGAPKVIYQKVTEIDIEEVNVDAVVVKPSVSFLQETKHKGFPPMIALRVNFDDVMEASVDLAR